MSQEEHAHHNRPEIPSEEELAKLPPDGGDHWNRLVFEQSPYLLQHAANPVDWYPWGEEAFAKARELDKPVFLSIGYSTCHWCHVMERESFEVDEIGKLLSEAFVCIKVDREERPDIDHVYMTVTQALTGSGGWPMTVIMTADKKPFFAGTYFPPDTKYGRPGLRDVISSITDIWHSDRSRAVNAAETISTELKKLSSAKPGDLPDATLLEENFDTFDARFEPIYGGFSQRPKFPVPHNLLFLMRHYQMTGNQRSLEMVEKTIKAMRMGGVYDQVGFGIHRYSTDAEWLVPHFEKMLYDQALTVLACVEAWQLTSDRLYKETADEILTYVSRDMTDSQGGFYSAEDADSEGEEGKFYVWSNKELLSILGEEDGFLFVDLFNFEVQGNFRDESTGKLMEVNIPHLTKLPREYAQKLGIGLEELGDRMEVMRKKLFDVREKRIHPLKDDKILTDWNGLMIAAYGKAAKAFDSEAYYQQGKAAADYILDHMRDENGRLYKRSRLGKAGLPSHLEDYAFLVWGLLELYEAGFEEKYLIAAGDLLDLMIEHYQDDENGGFFQTADDGEELLVRSKEIYDGATPSGNAVAGYVLLRYGRMLALPRYEEAAERTLKAFSGQFKQSPGNFSLSMMTLSMLIGPSYEVVLTGDRESSDFQKMAKAVRRAYLPNAVLVHRPTDDASPLLQRSELLTSHHPKEGKVTVYLCQDFACEQPTNDVDQFLNRIRTLERVVAKQP